MPSFRRGAVLATLLCLFSGAASAQFPSRGVQIVNPFPPGSPVEVVGRLVAQRLETVWKPHYVIVESKAGAGGTVGANAVAKAAPDGHTLLVTTASPISVAAALYKKLPYDPQRDLVPLWGIITAGQIVVVNRDLPVQNLAELVAYAKANPNKLSYASSGIGTVQHFAGERFKAATGTDLVHVPYKGGAPAATDLAGGHVQVMFDSLTNQLANLKAGKVRALAILRNKRDSKLPEVPTAAEAGVPGIEMVGWISLFAPGGTAPERLTQLRSTLTEVMGAPEAVSRMNEVFGEVTPLTGAQLEPIVAREVRMYNELVEKAGIARQ
jgi:tripartite-type tricarboxylate transporter receptor subunit TctC